MNKNIKKETPPSDTSPNTSEVFEVSLGKDNTTNHKELSKKASLRSIGERFDAMTEAEKKEIATRIPDSILADEVARRINKYGNDLADIKKFVRER